VFLGEGRPDLIVENLKMAEYLLGPWVRVLQVQCFHSLTYLRSRVSVSWFVSTLCTAGGWSPLPYGWEDEEWKFCLHLSLTDVSIVGYYPG
jgi:hypothetical protein